MSFTQPASSRAQRVKNRLVVEKQDQENSKQKIEPGAPMKVFQNDQDVKSEKDHKNYTAASTSLKKKLNTGRQYSLLYAALLKRPGASVGPDEMGSAVEGISDLHTAISQGVSKSVVGQKVNPVQLAMVGRSVAGISAESWVYDMSADDAVSLYTQLTENIKIKGQEEFISDELLAAKLSAGSASAKYINVINKLNALSLPAQQLYTGPFSPFDLASNLNERVLQIGQDIINSISSDNNNERDLHLAKMSIHSVLSELMSAAVVTEMNLMTVEFKAMSKPERTAYLKKMDASPETSDLIQRTTDAVILFSNQIYSKDQMQTAEEPPTRSPS